MLMVSWVTESNVVIALELASKARWAMIRLENSAEILTFDSSTVESFDRGQTVCSGDADGGCAAGQRSCVVAIALQSQSLHIGHVGQRQPANGLRLPIRIGSRYGAVRADGEALIRAAGVAVLRGGRGRGSCVDLTDGWGAAGAEDVPGHVHQRRHPKPGKRDAAHIGSRTDQVALWIECQVPAALADGTGS